MNEGKYNEAYMPIDPNKQPPTPAKGELNSFLEEKTITKKNKAVKQSRHRNHAASEAFANRLVFLKFPQGFLCVPDGV